MTDTLSFDDVAMAKDGFIYTLTLGRPPENFLDAQLIVSLAAAMESLDQDPDCRVIILASQGKHFCAGANLAKRIAAPVIDAKRHIYEEASRLVRISKPVIAAIQGAAIGAGLGLALVADFRVGCEQARFSANFNRQGYYPGFGMTFTLPRLVGGQQAAWMLYSGQRLKGHEALAIGLIDRLVPAEDLMDAARTMAFEIAASGPLAVQATRSRLRADIETGFVQAVCHEMQAQDRLRMTHDFQEGVRAMNERRMPIFRGE